MQGERSEIDPLTAKVDPMCLDEHTLVGAFSQVKKESRTLTTSPLMNKLIPVGLTRRLMMMEKVSQMQARPNQVKTRVALGVGNISASPSECRPIVHLQIVDR